ncbi:MAG: ThuA domain-containing protein [Armatimonadetes bacterium]|nr:ThuA domain-containing protein [Armatimonadota bacterium]MDE2207718.1 ThuA domain-containing protein [Armatimonadota bacterium]
MASTRLRVRVWDEHPSHAPRDIYPTSINGSIAEGLEELDTGRLQVTVGNLDEAGQGVSQADLDATDVLFWWGHARHGEVTDETAGRVQRQAHERGMGLVALHSAHYSKAFQWVVGASGNLKGGWRETTPPDVEHVRVCAPWHPIAQGVEDFTLHQEEMYGAPFDVPPPLCMVLQSHFPLGNETFPSGLCWTVGPGRTEGFACGPGGGVGEGEGICRAFYFRPGHETFPTYFHPAVRRILYNAALWCAPQALRADA